MFPGGPELIQEYVETNKIIVDGGDRYGVSTLCYDSQELLWMGNQGVCIKVNVYMYYHGFINIREMPVFVDFIVELFHKIKYS